MLFSEKVPKIPLTFSTNHQFIDVLIPFIVLFIFGTLYVDKHLWR